MLPQAGRSPIAIGFEWATRISLVGVTFVVPILVGHVVDRWLGSTPIGLMVGLILGLVIGMKQLIRIAGDSSAKRY